jgi:SSS family solute:Na+ symporter
MLSFFITAYLLLTILIGFWAAKRVKTSTDYMLAGKSLPAFMVGITIFCTWFGSEMIMGVPAHFVKEGVKGLIIDAGGGTLCLILIAVFFTRPVYKLNILTVNDFFEMRYGKGVESVTSVIIIFSYFSWVASQLLALAYIFESLYGWQVNLGVLIAAAIVVLYTYVGGMWAVSLTDLIQAVVMILGLGYIFLVLNSQSDGLITVLSRQNADFFKLTPEKGLYNWTDYLHKWMIFGIGSIVSQEIYQRVLSARSERKAVTGVFFSSFLMFSIGILPSLVGIIIYDMKPELIESHDGQNLLPDMITNYMGLPVQIIFLGALISAILSTASGAILAPATVLAENLIRSNRTRLTDTQLLLTTRISVLIMALISCGYTFLNDSIHELVINSVTLITTSMTAPFILGFYWKRSSVAGAWAGIICGTAVWFFSFMAETRIEPTILGFLASFAGVVLGSLIKPDTSRIRFIRKAAYGNQRS